MKVDEIRNICNLGTGMMGFGTALMFAAAGYNVRMFGRTAESLARGFNNIKESIANLCANDLVKQAGVPEILGRIKGVTDLAEAARDAHFVIESIVEDLAVKQEIFKKMEGLCPPETIFATNTSGLSPTAVAQVLQHKGRLIVAHFWNPPHLMPLVEVVPGRETDQEVINTTWKLVEKIGKKPVALKRDAPGFIGNRLQLALLREALYIVESGIATKEAVDTAVKYGFGRRLATTGPIESNDLAGLDMSYKVSSYLNKVLCKDENVSPLLKDAVEKGNLGAKTGAGLYKWTPEALKKIKKARDENLIEWLKKDKEEEKHA